LASGSWSGNKTASGDSETRTGLAAGTHTYTITCSKAGVSNALASVTVRVDDGVREVSDANQVTAATNGRYLAHYDEDDEYLYTSLEGNWVDPLNGTVPLNNVDIKFQFRGSAMLFADEVRFDCTNNGSIERTISVNSERRSEAIAFDLCNYSSPGTYTARATGWKRNGGVMRIATCYDRPCDDTATIISVTTPLPPDFSLNKNRDIFANIIGRDAVTSNESTLTIAAFDGFASTINLSVDSISPALPGAVFNFSDASLTSGEYARGSQFSVTVPSSTPSGIYTITIRGIDGGLVRTLNVKLNVNARDPSFREI
jgi:hypothetical protein